MSFRAKGTRTVLPFGLDYSDVLSSNYDVEKPKLILPINAPLSSQENTQAVQAINLSKLVLDGPFFTGNSLDDNQKTTSLTLADGIERHSDKYKKIKKIGTTIEDFPLKIDYFPPELYSVMGVSNKKRKIGLSSYKASTELQDPEALKAEAKSHDAAAILLNLESLAEDEGKNEKEEEEEEEEEEQDDYEDDEDDDYNAERYFDDGDDEEGGGDDDEAAF